MALGPEMRRGVADLDGQGDVVGGIVVMRQGENALNVIERVKAKLEELEALAARRAWRSSPPTTAPSSSTRPSTPCKQQAHRGDHHRLAHHPGLPLAHPVGDRPHRHHPGVAWRWPSSRCTSWGSTPTSCRWPASPSPSACWWTAPSSRWRTPTTRSTTGRPAGSKGDFHQVRLEALLEVGPGGLLLAAGDRRRVPAGLHAGGPGGPALQAAGLLEEPRHGDRRAPGRSPSTRRMRMLFARIEPFRSGRGGWPGWPTRLLVGHATTPRSGTRSAGLLHRLYERPCRFVLRHAEATIARQRCCWSPLTVPVYLRLGSEFMPPLDEGSILYMPSAVQPGMSVAEAQKALQVQDKILRDLPRGGARLRQGRPRRHLHRPGAVLDDGDHRPAQARAPSGARSRAGTRAWAPGVAEGASCARSGATASPRTSCESEMDAALQLPGISNAWTMPIKGRLDMLSTGIRTPVGIKIFGADLEEIQRIAHRDRGGPAQGARHAQRLRRARRRRLLPRLRAQARPAGPLRPVGRRRQHDGDDRGRRRRPDHHRRGPRALRHQRALRPRLPRRPRRAARACSCRCPSGGADPDGGDRRRRAGAGAGDDPRRERAARRLRLRRLRHLEGRRRQLRRRGPRRRWPRRCTSRRATR